MFTKLRANRAQSSWPTDSHKIVYFILTWKCFDTFKTFQIHVHTHRVAVLFSWRRLSHAAKKEQKFEKKTSENNNNNKENLGERKQTSRSTSDRLYEMRRANCGNKVNIKIFIDNWLLEASFYSWKRLFIFIFYAEWFAM